MAQQANLTLELDKVKDLLLCQGDTGVVQLLNAALAKILKAKATKQIITSLIREAIIAPLSEMGIEPVSSPLDLGFLNCAFQS